MSRISTHAHRLRSPPSSLASTDETNPRASGRAQLRPVVPRWGRVREWLRRPADVPAAAPHDHHDAPDGGRLVAHVVAIRGFCGALAWLQCRPPGLAGADLRSALDRGGTGRHRGGPHLPLANNRSNSDVTTLPGRRDAGAAAWTKVR